MKPQQQDYATEERLAMYLEAGWSDFLFEPTDEIKSAQARSYPDPFRHKVPPDFFCNVATLAESWVGDLSVGPKSFCDLGGGTGRTVFEFERKFPSLERLVLVEPSGRFCDWAHRLLASDERLPDVPILNRVGATRWVAPRTRPPPIPRADQRFAIVEGTLEEFEPKHKFDLVTCLNVVDRHARPMEIVHRLGEVMNDDGLLIMSSPFDFSERATPDRTSWIDDLNFLFEDTDCWSHVAQDELFYEFRFFNRNWTRFLSQVVGKRRREK